MTSAELQELIDGTPDGGTVVIPPGMHEIDSPLDFRRHNHITMCGEDGAEIRSDGILVLRFYSSYSRDVKHCPECGAEIEN